MPISQVPDLPQNVPIVDSNGVATPAFARYFSANVRQALNALVAGSNAQDAADMAAAAAASAQTAADTAQTAAETAATTGADAQAAADAAAAQAAANAREASLVNSGINPDSVLTATATIITVAPHARIYGDGSSVAVSGGTVAATGGVGPYVDYVSYVDPARTGGAVTFVASTTNPGQTGDTHVVGAITIPASGTATGGRGPRKPGFVLPDD